MGAVYKARQRSLDRLVALKIIRPQSAHDPGFALRFGREARALARLGHPHIVAIHDFGQRNGLYYLIMEYVDGANLRQVMQAGNLTPEQALSIVPRLCETLQYAHDEGVIHRDIKPENILVDCRGRVKIADFGLAKLAGDDTTAWSLTGPHHVFGTPRYMAPEQMQSARQVDHRADIYSLGVVLYEMLTGELPMGRFAPPSHRAQVDTRLDEVVLRTLERDPERRYQHAVDVKTDIESITSEPQCVAESKSDSLESRTPERQLCAGTFRQVPLIPIACVIALSILQCASCGVSMWPLLRMLVAGEVAFFPLAFGLLAKSVGAGAGLVALMGGVLAWRCGYVWLARLAALALMLPIGSVWLLGIPVGIWVLWTTQRHDVYDEKQDSLKPSARSEGNVWPWRGVGAAVVVIILLAAFVGVRSGITRQLGSAARTGNAIGVRWWLWLGADPNRADAEGASPLMWSASEGHSSVVTALITAGAVIDATTPNGETPLMMGSFHGQTDAVGLLLGAGADPVLRDTDGENALMRAAARGHVPVVDLLLIGGAPIDDASPSGMTPLLWAAWHGHGDVVRRLVRGGADVRKRSNDGETALMKAAFHGHDDVVFDLLAYGCEVNTQDESGETALLLAAATGNQSTVATLLERGADLDLVTRQGTTALMTAARQGHLPVMRLLLSARAEVDARNTEGRSALDEAMLGGQFAAAEALREAGAQTDGRFTLWQAFRTAHERGHIQALPLLEQAAKDTTTPLGSCQWTIGGWEYEIPAPAALAWLLVGEAHREADQTSEAGAAFTEARAALPSTSSDLLLVRRVLRTPERDVVQTFHVPGSLLERLVTEPASQFTLLRDEEQRWYGGHSTSSGQPVQVAELFR
jgi:ankyrin repeat protein